MTRQPGRARRHRLLTTIFALSACLALIGSKAGAAEEAALATSFTVAGDTTLTIHSDETSEKLVKVRIRVLGEAAVTAVAQQSLTFLEGSQSLEVVEAYTEKQDGRKVTVDAGSIITRDAASGMALVLMRDLKSTTLIFPDVAVGDTLVFTYRLTIRVNPLGHLSDLFVFPRAFPYADTRVRVVAPRALPLKLAVLGDGLKEETTEDGDTTTHLVTLSARPRVTAEPGETSPLDHDARIVISTFKDFDDLGKSWMAAGGARATIAPEIKTLADEITKGIGDRRAQAEAIDRWVKRNIRYVAIYLDAAAGLIPHDPVDVLKNRYGDCKDHAALMAALLAAKGIASEAVMINAANAFAISPDIASTGYFNHMIIYIPEFGLYDDPTVGYAAFGVLGEGDYDKPVLRVSAEGATLARTPTMKPQDHVSTNHTTITVAADRTISGETKESGSGVFGWGLRGTTATIQHTGAEKAAEGQLKSSGIPGKGHYVLTGAADMTDPFTLTSEFKLDAKLAGPGALQVIPVGLTTRARAGRYLLNLRYDARTLPFMCFAGRQVEEIDMTFADGLPLPLVPKGRKIENPYFTYSASYQLEQRTLKVRREFVSLVPGQACAPEVEAAVAEPLKGVYADLDTKLRMPAAPKPPAKPTPPAPKQPDTVAEVKKPDTVAEVKQPDTVAEVKQPDTVAEVKQPDTVVEVKKPDTVVEVKQPDTVAEVKKPDTVVEVKQPDTVVEVKKPDTVVEVKPPVAPAPAQPQAQKPVTPAEARVDNPAAFIKPAEEPASVKPDAGIAPKVAEPSIGPTVSATDEPNRGWCSGSGNATADLRIHGCTAIIQSGAENLQSLAVAFANRGFAYRMKGDYGRALADFEQAIRLLPNYAVAFNGRGLTWQNLHDYDRAIADFSAALRLSPTFAVALVNRGNVYRDAGSPDLAMADFDQAMRLDPTLVYAYLSRGRAYRVAADYDRALADFDEAIRLKRDNAFAWAERCFTQAVADNPARALLACNEALRLKPHDAYALDNRGFALLKLRDLEGAMADFEAVLRLNPKDARALYGRGLVRMRMGDVEAGKADIAAARSIRPSIAEDFPKIAVMRAARDEHTGSTGLMREAIVNNR